MISNVVYEELVRHSTVVLLITADFIGAEKLAEIRNNESHDKTVFICFYVDDDRIVVLVQVIERYFGPNPEL